MKQISLDEIERGDWRFIAGLPFKFDEFEQNYDFDFTEYEEDGLGPCKAAAFELKSGRQVLLKCLLWATNPFMYLESLSNQSFLDEDIDEVLAFLKVNDEDVLCLHSDQEGDVFKLWRQDDHGTQYNIKDYDNRVDAVLKLLELKRQSHKQEYWVERRKVQQGSGDDAKN